jgi:hypothetical protein
MLRGASPPCPRLGEPSQDAPGRVAPVPPIRGTQPGCSGARRPRAPDQGNPARMLWGASPPCPRLGELSQDAPGRVAPVPPIRGTRPVPLKPLRQARPSRQERYRFMPWPHESEGAHRSTHARAANANERWGCPRACRWADTSIRPYGAPALAAGVPGPSGTAPAPAAGGAQPRMRVAPRHAGGRIRRSARTGRVAPVPPIRGTQPGCSGARRPRAPD